METSPAEQLLYRPEAAAHVLDVGRSTVFELIAEGQLKSVKIGRCRRIPHTALVDYVQRLQAGAGSPAA